MNFLKKAYCRTFQKILHIAMPFLPYRKQTVLYKQDEVPSYFAQKGIKKVLLVTDSFLKSSGATKALEDALHKGGIKYAVYDKTCPNPTVDNVEDAKNIYLKNNCEGIVAFGGGSPMDCAKGVAIRIARPKTPLNKLGGILKVMHRLPTMCAIPTTAGTGSEATLAAVITDSETHYKYAIMDFCVEPHCAVLDHSVTMGLPPHMTSTTGMDALTHAVEAYIGRSTIKETRANAEIAVKLIFENIERAYKDGSDEEARKNMLYASYVAGKAFSKSYVGYVHSIAHSLGGQYGIPHGLANAVILPYVLEGYGKAAHKKLHKLAVVAGVAEETDSHRVGAEKFIAAIRELSRRMNIPDKLEGIKEEDIPKMAKNAEKESNPLYPVPVLWTKEELSQFYRLISKEEYADNEEKIDSVIELQREYFQTGETLKVKNRIAALKTLHKVIKNSEDEICTALRADLGKSDMEGFMCEVGLVLSEISYMISHTRRYAREKTVYTPITQFPSRSYHKKVPFGNVLIMSPWNYPFLLTMEPLADALAAGNTAIIKPSAYSPATSAVIEKIITRAFPKKQVTVITGGREENAHLLERKFDMVFFTGSQAVGREVLRHASENLTPCVLELGGKSPCIVDSTAKIKLAAKRIVFGKFLNCGQTCVAPDYILCDRSIKDKLVAEIIRQIKLQFGDEPLKNPDYGKIINEKHFERICSLIDKSKVRFGGKTNAAQQRIEPTVMNNVTWDDAIMQQEIFGPVLPVLTYDSFDDIFALIEERDHPLALYIFSEDKKHIRAVTSRCRYGGGCVNDVVIHLATSQLGFGGVGGSGMGAYHGKIGFDAFSHNKNILNKKTWLDLPMRYQPYKKIYDKLIHFFLR